jgi:hypothetical protein
VGNAPARSEEVGIVKKIRINTPPPPILGSRTRNRMQITKIEITSKYIPKKKHEGRIYNLPKELKSMNSTETIFSGFCYTNSGVW